MKVVILAGILEHVRTYRFNSQTSCKIALADYPHIRNYSSMDIKICYSLDTKENSSKIFLNLKYLQSDFTINTKDGEIIIHKINLKIGKLRCDTD